MVAEPAPSFDLQSHSTASDGALLPAEVVARAAAAGVELLALTDHDTVDGVAEASRAAAEHGLRLVPAAELSSIHADLTEDLHILGYGLDASAPVLLEALHDFRADRQRRVLAMAERLREEGFSLASDELTRRRDRGMSLGRPHLAQAVLGHPANARRLRDEGITGVDALFDAYLVPGTPAYVRRERPTVEQAIALIHDAGGVAVWAHPFWDYEEPSAVLIALERFAAAGLDGVEAFYVTHSADQVRMLHQHASHLGLMTTGSADFHGPEHPRFNRFRAFELHGLEPDLGPLAG
jgi:predicted metal-dependent phosphoesterase TrpH